MIHPIRIVLEHEGAKVHGLIWVDPDVIFVNVTVKGALHTEGIWIKVEDYLGGVGVHHEEDVRTGREKV